MKLVISQQCRIYIKIGCVPVTLAPFQVAQKNAIGINRIAFSGSIINIPGTDF
jgi:hypothetical protein